MRHKYLSQLAYECIVGANVTPRDFNYTQFKAGRYDNDSELADVIRAVPNAINLAFARLYDNHKFRTYSTSCLYGKVYGEEGVVYPMPSTAFEIKNAFRKNLSTGERTNYEFENVGDVYVVNSRKADDERTWGIRTIFWSSEDASQYCLEQIANGYHVTVDGKWYKTAEAVNAIQWESKLGAVITPPINGAAYFEYYKEIPHADEDNIKTSQIDLADYGFSETMISYVIEFVKGQLLETLEPSMANEHNARAENYFADIPDYFSSQNQNRVVRKFSHKRR